MERGLKAARLTLLVLVLISCQTVSAQTGTQQFSIGQDAMPASVEVNSAGEITLIHAGQRILEQGKFFVSRSGDGQALERVSIVTARRVEIPDKRLLLPIPPAQRSFAVELEGKGASDGDQLVRFVVRGLSISLVGDPQPGLTYWFIGRIDWGGVKDLWLVDLGDWPQGRLTTLPRLMQATVVQQTPPGFTSAPRNPQIFQVASGAVTNLNHNALYDQARDRALVFRGPHVELVPERHEDSSPYLVKARLGGGAESTPQDSRRALLSMSERGSVIGSQVQFFRPMSEERRKRFPAAPSGWLSIYSGLRREDTEKEFWKNQWVSEHYEEHVIKGADWFVKNLRPDAYGPINIGVNDLHGMKEIPHKRWTLGNTPDWMDRHRDWRLETVTTFPHGAKWLADQIHKRGMQLGSWAIPDGWDAEDLYKEHPNWFLHYPDGTPIYFGWAGKYYMDGSNPEGLKFLRDEMHKYTTEWGIDNWWVDGNYSGLLAGYASAAPYFYDKSVPWWEAHRRLIQAMRDGAGPNSYIHMDCPIPLTAMGVADGSRTAGDPNALAPPAKYGDGNCCQDWLGAVTARTGTMDWYFLNRTGWYCDPSDAFNVGYPLTLDQAHIWGPMLSLTGQVMMLGDPVYELGPDRVEIVKAIFPSPPVRPVELYSRQGQVATVWDLRVGHLGRQWDVVMFNNFETQPRTVAVTLADLGLDPGGKYLLFDFWGKKSLGIVSEGRIELSVPAEGSRLVRLTPLTDHPEVFGLTRHVTQGLVDLHALAWEGTNKVLRGESLVPGGDPYQFWVNVPQGYSFRSVTNSAGQARCESASPGVLTCTILSPDTAPVSWGLQF